MNTTTAIRSMTGMLAMLLALPLAAQAQDGGRSSPSPEGRIRVVALATDPHHTCPLRAAGSAACRGDNRVDRAPATVFGRFIAIAAGEAHTCGSKADGSVACLGAGTAGTSGIPICMRTAPFVVASFEPSLGQGPGAT